MSSGGSHNGVRCGDHGATSDCKIVSAMLGREHDDAETINKVMEEVPASQQLAVISELGYASLSGKKTWP